MVPPQAPYAGQANAGRPDAAAYVALVFLLTFILLEDLRSPPILTGSETYATLFPLVESMEDRPQARNEVLAAFSKALREGYGGGEDPELAINLIVRKHNEIIFSSRGAPTEVKNSRTGKCSASGPETTRTSRTLKSARSDVEVTLFTPAAAGISLST